MTTRRGRFSQFSQRLPDFQDYYEGEKLRQMVRILSAPEIEREIENDVITITSADSPYNVLPNIRVVLANATGGNIIVNFPFAADYPRRLITVLKVDASANTVTVTPQAGDTINAAASAVATFQFSGTETHSNGVTAWYGFNISLSFEVAQDAVGSILTDTATIDFTYDDATPAITADVKNDSITFAKIQNISTDRLLGRDTAGSGDTEEISLDDTLEFTGSASIQRAALTGDVTASAGSNATTIPAGTVTFAKAKVFTSSEQTITSAGSLTIAHGLGAKPQAIFAWLVCKTAEANYSVNDEVFTEQGINVGGFGSASAGISVVPDSTNLNVRYGSLTNVFTVLDKSTGAATALTNGNWRLVLKAWA